MQENPRITFADPIVPPPPPALNPNLVFGQPQNSNNFNTNNFKPPQSQLPAPQMPLDIPRLPDNRQPFPASPNQNNNFFPFHPDLTPPPNVFGPFRNSFITTTREPSLLQQFLNNKNASTINNANLNLTIFGLLFLLLTCLRNNMIHVVTA